jgi:hypothetical protein
VQGGSDSSLAAPKSASALLAEQLAVENRGGSCAEPYRTLQNALARLLKSSSTQPRTAVEAAARTVVAALPHHICRASSGGTWALFYDDLRGMLGDDANDAVDRGTYPLFHVEGVGRLVFIPASAAPRQQAPFSLAGGPLLSLRTTDGDGFSAQASTVDDLEIGDTDGDGVAEVLVTGRRGVLPLLEGADTRPHLSALFRVSDTGPALDPRAPAGIAFDHLADGDGDGLFDLVSPLPFFGDDEGNLSDIELQGPELLWHATRSGFSRTDDAARAFASKSCPSRPHALPSLPAEARSDAGGSLPIYLTDSAEQAIHDVACARLWGVPTDTVRRWVEQVNGGRELARWAALAPPFTLGTP